MGRWDDAVRRLQESERIDPRSVFTTRRLGQALIWLRRYAEAQQALDRGLAIAPASLALVEYKAMSFLGRGDFAGARAAYMAAPREGDPNALPSYFASIWDIVWVLDRAERQHLLGLSADEFGADEATWALALMQAASLNDAPDAVRSFAEKAVRAYREQLQTAPEDGSRRLEL